MSPGVTKPGAKKSYAWIASNAEQAMVRTGVKIQGKTFPVPDPVEEFLAFENNPENRAAIRSLLEDMNNNK